MKFGFDPKSGLIIATAKITGPEKDIVIRLALDTGATSTLINKNILFACGYKANDFIAKTRVTTGSRIEHVLIYKLVRIEALGKINTGLKVLAHNLPETTTVDGLLGLDFFREHILKIDFIQGEISITE